MTVRFNSEKLAYWYFRLNGFFTIENFIVHPDNAGESQRTDADILCVRFPYRSELYIDPMEDDFFIKHFPLVPVIIIAEVKHAKCRLNGPWTKKERQNIHRVLKAIGSFPDEAIKEVAQSLYDRGIYLSDKFYVSLACVGTKHNKHVAIKYSDVPQITFYEIATFIFNRFSHYREQKKQHVQWDDSGQYLWKLFMESPSEAEFERRILEVIEKNK